MICFANGQAQQSPSVKDILLGFGLVGVDKERMSDIATQIGKMNNDSQMMDATTSVGETNIATSSRTNAPPTMALAEKPEKFSGIDFKW
ncbi:hypothetical protein CQW23_27793 [Capsicum baccatum]|uniref:Uncharacterized protein n=1 Tax=Capsicum baccatum TaxID=33114 RepID=A0A2G2VER7_CAPBA|nr:hypothetical protein CQW23_27793 [Capsicum baccatum]